MRAVSEFVSRVLTSGVTSGVWSRQPKIRVFRNPSRASLPPNPDRFEAFLALEPGRSVVVKTAVIMLAGGLRPGSLRSQLGFPTAGMPLERDRTLMQAWLELITSTPALDDSDMLIACNSEKDRAWFAAEARRFAAIDRCPRVVVDPRAHRGVAGMLLDLRGEVSNATSLAVVELNSLPPSGLGPLLAESPSAGLTPSMRIGVGPDARWTGVYRLDAGLLDHVTSRGYVDLKEQFIPQLLARGYRIDAADFTDTPVQISDRRDYLRAVRIWRSRVGLAAEQSNEVSGFSVVCPGVDVRPGAHIADSAVLPGAVVGAGAVVARSIIGPMIHVPEGSIIVDALLADPSAVSAAIDDRVGAVSERLGEHSPPNMVARPMPWSIQS
jgi:hypothetical protein